jgi:hypothetical protein
VRTALHATVAVALSAVPVVLLTPDSAGTGFTNLSDVDLRFTVDAAGTVQPVTGQTIGFLEQTECTISETGNGGASTTSYQCTGRGASVIGIDAAGAWDDSGAATAENPDDPCVTSGPQAEPMVVDIVTAGQEAAVTVSDTRPAIAPIVDVVPRFTG